MLSISTLKGSGGALAGYFEKDSGEADYWSKEAGESATWVGAGATELGLSGAVNQASFEMIMDRNLPGIGQLPGGQGGARRMGYDLTFSAPKSLSIQALVTGDQRLLSAHQEAVKETLFMIEKDVLKAQFKAGGKVHLESTGKMTAAVFAHETSRELDPQIHSHAVVANITRTANGKWRALEGSQFYKHKMLAGAEYRARLAAKVQDLGYKVKVTHGDGRFELKGISRKQIEAFSKRRVQIESALKASGHKGAKASEVASLATRKAKVSHLNKAQLKETWKSAAKKTGINLKMPTKPLNALSQAQRTANAQKAVKQAFTASFQNGKAVPLARVEGKAMGFAVGKASPSDVRKAVVKLSKGQVCIKNGMAQPSRKLALTSKLKIQASQLASRSLQANARRSVLSVIAPPGVGQMLSALSLTRQVGKGVGREEGRGMSR